MPKLTMSTIEQRINSIYSTAEICKSTSTEIQDRINKEICMELDSKYSNGRNRYTSWIKGFASGYIMAKEHYLMQNLVEFCYEVDNILYSTHKDTTKRSTEELYKADKYKVILNSCSSNFYWKNSNKPYTTLKK